MSENILHIERKVAAAKAAWSSNPTEENRKLLVAANAELELEQSCEKKRESELADRFRAQVRASVVHWQDLPETLRTRICNAYAEIGAVVALLERVQSEANHEFSRVAVLSSRVPARVVAGMRAEGIDVEGCVTAGLRPTDIFGEVRDQLARLVETETVPFVDLSLLRPTLVASKGGTIQERADIDNRQRRLESSVGRT